VVVVHGSSGTQKRECPPLEAGTGGLVKVSALRRLNAFVVNFRVSEIELGCKLQ
jgi:hypothetical protein